MELAILTTRDVERVLVVNAGSSSLKVRVLDRDDNLVASRDLAAPDEIASALPELGRIDAAGHRIVHGGTAFTAPVRLDDSVITALEALTDLAPLHQPTSLEAMRATRAALPSIAHVACFDTAFHATLPAAASTYALPEAWRKRWPLRRFGFHGLSHAYASRTAAGMLRRDDAGFRVVTCHLGSGASLAAVLGGRSIDTTMGFTPLEGLVMASRSGSIDPGLVLWLEQHAGLPAAVLGEELERRSGLVGLAGTGDMHAVLAAEAAGDERARLALSVYLHRLCAGIAAMAAAMNGLDALVFTGGVGEHEPAIRERASAGLGFLGVAVDPRADATSLDADISTVDAVVRTVRITAREDIEIARGVRALLGGYGE